MMRDEGYWEAVIGRVVGKDSGEPLAKVKVRAFDKDAIKDDFLGETETDDQGKFRIEFSQRAYQGALALAEGRPDIYLKLTHPDGRTAKTAVIYEAEGLIEDEDDPVKGGPDGEIEVIDMGDVLFP